MSDTPTFRSASRRAPRARKIAAAYSTEHEDEQPGAEDVHRPNAGLRGRELVRAHDA